MYRYFARGVKKTTKFTTNRAQATSIRHGRIGRRVIPERGVLSEPCSWLRHERDSLHRVHRVSFTEADK